MGRHQPEARPSAACLESEPSVKGNPSPIPGPVCFIMFDLLGIVNGGVKSRCLVQFVPSGPFNLWRDIRLALFPCHVISLCSLSRPFMSILCCTCLFDVFLAFAIYHLVSCSFPGISFCFFSTCHQKTYTFKRVQKTLGLDAFDKKDTKAPTASESSLQWSGLFLLRHTKCRSRPG